MSRARKNVMDPGVDGPIPRIRAWTFGPHRYGRAQAQRIEYGIEDMAPHVAESACAEIQPLAPIGRMIVAVVDDRTIGADAQPHSPIEALWH